MARDNAACNRAIRKAWQRERELVLAGKGSRNWTPEQREQLITKGKVYDADGKAFIGQHMKSVSGFPDNQGDADNIQLLSQEEHLEAHKGDWHNVTNWYYDPDTKSFYDFDLYNYSEFPPDDYCNFHPEEYRVPLEVISEEPPKEKSKESTAPKKKIEEPPKPKIEPQKKPGFFSKMRGGAKTLWTDTVWPLIKEHPLESIGIVVGLVKVGLDIKDAVSGNHSSDRSCEIGTSDDFTASVDRNTDFGESGTEEPIDHVSTVEEEVDDSSSGTPKCPHSRRGYPGHRWKKNEDGDLELTETWISPAKIHPEQMDDDE